MTLGSSTYSTRISGLLKQYRPYHESDHVLNIAYNVLCDGQVLDDIELRRNDAGYLNALGARSIPDPTTAGDFCRRFDYKANWRLMSAINETRLGVWRRLGQKFVEQTARIDADGTMVPTQGACKQGMDLSHKGVWGYHPLLVSLANTGEPLFIVNRSENRPSHEHAPEVFDRAIDLCRRAGFQDILLRGDTDFSLTAHFDRWTDLNVRFVFGYDSSQPMVSKAQAVDDDEYRELVRKADSIFEAKRRAKQPRVKDEIVFERGYYNITLETEDITEFEHKPSKARRAYRFVVLRKTLVEERGQICTGTSVRSAWSTFSCKRSTTMARQRCSISTMARPIVVKRWRRSTDAWASTCSMPIPTILRRVARRSASGARCARVASTTSATSTPYI